MTKRFDAIDEALRMADKSLDLIRKSVAKLRAEERCVCGELGCPNDKGDLCDMTAQREKQ